jgi:LysM repeat protein
MKTPLLVSTVVAAHVVAVVGVVLIQGCGVSTRPDMAAGQPPEPVMPPTVSEVESVVVATPVAPIDLPEAKVWPDETETYVVAQGESLSTIARRHGLSVAEVVALNRLTDPNKIRAGQTLVLPTGSSKTAVVAPPPASVAVTPIAIPPGASTYVVKSGDSLSVIAQRAGVKTSELKAANGLSGDKIMVGQKLVLPGAAAIAAPSSYQGAPAAGTSLPELDDADVGTLALREELDLPSTAAMTESVETAAEAAVTGTADAGEAVAPPTQPVSSDIETRPYVVSEEDEDLYSVAMMWGVSVQRLKEINKLADTKLTVGQKLLIPIAE